MKAFGKYLGVEKIKENVAIAGDQLLMSSMESQRLSIQKGKVTHVSDEWSHAFNEGDVAYYNKARAFDIKDGEGKTVTMIPVESVVAVDPFNS